MSHSNDIDARLVMRARSDKDAFTEIYEKSYNQIFGYLLRRCNNYSLAQDLTSETYLKVVQKIHLYKPRKNKPFLCWLYRVASNELNMYYRKQNKYRFVELEKIPYLASDNNPKEELELLETEKDRLQNYQSLHYCLVQLSEIEQTVLSLHYFEKKHFHEISQITGKNESSVRSIAHRAKKKLHKLMQRDGNDRIILTEQPKQF